MLEQIAYEILRTEQRQQAYFVVGDLESLSASALYYGKGNAVMPGERISLTIRPLGPNSALHIHEGKDGTAHIKTRKNEYVQITSYKAAMIDLLLDEAGVKKIKK